MLFIFTMPSFFLLSAPTPTEIYTLSLHDALPIFAHPVGELGLHAPPGLRVDDDRLRLRVGFEEGHQLRIARRSEEHTSELQSRRDLVCRLLLEKKNISQTF